MCNPRGGAPSNPRKPQPRAKIATEMHSASSKTWKCTLPAFREGSVVPVGGIVDLRDFALVPLNLEFVLESPRFYRRFCELLLPGLSCYYSDRRRGQLNNGGSRDGLLRRKDPPNPRAIWAPRATVGV